MSIKSSSFNNAPAVGSRYATLESPEFRIYEKPFCNVAKYAHVTIATYGLTNRSMMQPIVDILSKRECKVTLLVGYSKRTHNLREMSRAIHEYMRAGWYVKVLPGCHLKVWCIGSDAWVGSMNFVRQTAPNLMVCVPLHTISSELNLLLNKATRFSQGTQLHLVPSHHE